MQKHVDYFMSLQSPWTYLGHQRLREIAAKHAVEVRIYPLEFGQVFAATGGLPLPQRPPTRRAYRMMELKRWREHLALPMVLEPKHFPVAGELSTKLVIAAREAGEDAMALAGAILRAVWAEEKNISDPEVLVGCANAAGVKGEDLLSAATATDGQLEKDTEVALAAGVFGAPTYVYDNELFWGQDRLDFLERAVNRG